MTDEEEPPLFRLSETEHPSDIFTIYIVILHRLEDRASLRDLELILNRLALKPSERFNQLLKQSHDPAHALNAPANFSGARPACGTRLAPRAFMGGGRARREHKRAGWAALRRG